MTKMRRQHKKNEASIFYMTLLCYHNRISIGDDDYVWEKIIEEIYNIEKTKSDIFNIIDLPYEYPFISADKPDIYYETDKFIMGIEHFTIDSSCKKRKGGSKIYGEIDKIDRAIDKERLSSQDKYKVYSKSIDCTFSLENYENVLLENFDMHLNRVKEYICNLSKQAPNKEVKLTFFIEDTTPIGNTVITEKGREVLNPLFIKSFIDRILKSEKIDYFVIKSQRDYIPYVYFFQVTAENIKKLNDNSYNLSTTKLVPLRIVREISYSSCDED